MVSVSRVCLVLKKNQYALYRRYWATEYFSAGAVLWLTSRRSPDYVSCTPVAVRTKCGALPRLTCMYTNIIIFLLMLLSSSLFLLFFLLSLSFRSLLTSPILRPTPKIYALKKKEEHYKEIDSLLNVHYNIAIGSSVKIVFTVYRRTSLKFRLYRYVCVKKICGGLASCDI